MQQQQNNTKLYIKYHKIHLAAPPESKDCAGGASSYHLKNTNKFKKKSVVYTNTY